MEFLPVTPVGPQKPGSGNWPVEMDRRSFDRTEAAVKYVEGVFRGQPRLGGGERGTPTWLMKVKTPSGGIPAATANDTPGSGSAHYAYFDTSTNKYVATSETIPVVNPSGAIAGNWFITVGWVSGNFEPVVDPC